MECSKKTDVCEVFHLIPIDRTSGVSPIQFPFKTGSGRKEKKKEKKQEEEETPDSVSYTHLTLPTLAVV